MNLTNRKALRIAQDPSNVLIVANEDALGTFEMPGLLLFAGENAVGYPFDVPKEETTAQYKPFFIFA